MQFVDQYRHATLRNISNSCARQKLICSYEWLKKKFVEEKIGNLKIDFF